MGYAVVHMAKVKSGGVRGIQSHNQREKDPLTNPDIDKSRTKENYDMVNSQDINYNRAVKERIKTFATETTTVRKDAVVMCNMIVTSDEQTIKAMGAETQREFFKDSLEFFADRYGAENIVNATVHMDETTPHLHIGIVPIKDGRLSAKNLFTKSELRQLQTDFAKQVGEKYGLQRGIEGSEKTHLSEQRFKLEKAKEQEQKVLKIAYKAAKEVESIRDSLEPMKAEYEAKKAFIDQAVKDSEASVMYPSYAKVTEKGVFKKETMVTVPADKWEERHVSANQVSAILKSREALEQTVEKIKKRKPGDREQLVGENQRLRSVNDVLSRENGRLNREISSMKNFIERHPDIKKAFAMEKSIGKALDQGLTR